MNIYEHVLEKIDIVEVIEKYIQLKKQGSNYTGLCPFHSEKTPSFSVSPTNGLYHCFGCKASGNAITFISEIEGLSKLDAVRKLASDFFIDISFFEKNEEYDRKEIHHAILRDAALFYLKNLRNNNHALKYLTDRGLTLETIRKFGLGFADEKWDSLTNFLKRKYETSDLLQLGIVKKKDETGKIYDQFRNRIIFPIINKSEKIVGFGGRVIDDSQPKYLNSIDSKIFHKGKLLFGINFIKGKGRIIVTEGYMDVISLANHGIDRAVASLGTAFTTDQASIIESYADTVYLCFDSDTAGIKATLKTIDVFQTNKLFVVELGEGMDPDDFIKTHGKDAFENKIKNAITPIEFKIKVLSRSYNLNDKLEKVNFLKAATKIISKLKSDIEKNLYINLLVEKYDADSYILKREVFHTGFYKNTENKKPPKIHSNDSTLEENLLGLLLFNTEELSETEILKIKTYPFSENNQNVLNILFEDINSWVYNRSLEYLLSKLELNSAIKLSSLMNRDFNKEMILLSKELHDVEIKLQSIDKNNLQEYLLQAQLKQSLIEQIRNIT